jgi:uncharacterized protein
MMNDLTLPNPVPEIPLTSPSPPEKRVWGGWATAGYGALVLIVFVIVQAVVAIVALLALALTRLNPSSGAPGQDIINTIMDLAKDHLGLLQSLATIFSGLAGIGLIIIFIKMRRRAGIGEYLGLHRVTFKSVLFGLGIVIAFIFLSSGLDTLMGQADNEQIMFDIYNTSIWPALFWIAVVVFAPLFEEVLFRGFLFEGFRQSRLGAVGAIVITAFVWSLIHSFQYNLYGVAWIFILGIGMGFVRLKTGSIWNTILMHATVNIVATLEIALNVNRLFH